MGIGWKNLFGALHSLDVKSIEIKNCDIRDKIALYGMNGRIETARCKAGESVQKDLSAALER